MSYNEQPYIEQLGKFLERPPPRTTPPPPADQPISHQFPILYGVIKKKEETSNSKRDINGNDVVTSNGVSSSPSGLPRTRSYPESDLAPRYSRRQRHPYSLKHVPTWQLYFKNEFLLTGSALFRDEEVRAESEDPILNSKVSFWFGDIRTLEVDIVVNSTTSHLDGERGLDWAFHWSAGPELQQKCRELNPCAIGDVRITAGFALPAKHIIHAVAPTDKNKDSLKACYMKSLIILRQLGLKTIAFPCIGTGPKGFSRVDAARIALSTARVFLESEKENVERIIFCVHNKPNVQIYLRFMQTYFPSSPDQTYTRQET